MSVEENIRGKTEQKLAEMGCFLVSLKVLSNKKIIIEIDRNEGVKILDCVQLSKSLNNDPELETVFVDHELEVSSPGMDSPFRVFGQYLKNTGRKIRVKLTEGEISGTLISAKEEGIEIQGFAAKNKPEPAVQFIPFTEIKETRKIISFS